MLSYTHISPFFILKWFNESYLSEINSRGVRRTRLNKIYTDCPLAIIVKKRTWAACQWSHFLLNWREWLAIVQLARGYKQIKINRLYSFKSKLEAKAHLWSMTKVVHIYVWRIGLNAQPYNQILVIKSFFLLVISCF